MRKRLFGLMLSGVLGLGVAGCGVDDDFQAANRLLILELTGEGSTAPVFYANEATADLGQDGQADTGDTGENNRFPDSFETPTLEVSNDRGTLKLENRARLGVEEGVDLTVYRIDVTYADATGSGRAFAPTKEQGVTVTIPSGETAELEFTLVPVEMKTVDGGLREIFLYGSAADIAAVSRMTAFVDVYARDTLNDDRVHVQAAIDIQFVDPMKVEVVDG